MLWNRGTTIGSTKTRATTTTTIEAIGIITTIILTTMIMTMPSFTKVIAQQGNQTEQQQDTELSPKFHYVYTSSKCKLK
jgi:hypothetical protein